MKKLFILTIVLLFCGFIQAQATSEKDIADWNIALFERPYPDDWKKALTGKQKVYTSSPIYNKPDMVFGGKIGNTANEVEIVSKYNLRYYFVKSNGASGYMWTGWFFGHNSN